MPLPHSPQESAVSMDIDMDANGSEIEGLSTASVANVATSSSTTDVPNVAASSSSSTNSTANIAVSSSTNSADNSVAAVIATTEPPFYRMKVGLKTLREVWKEWKRGLDGGPAVEQLEAEWNTKWRNIKGKGTDRKYFDA